MHKIRVQGLAVGLALSGLTCPATSQPVLYTSTDQEYAEVVLKEAEVAIGGKTVSVFDAEAAKTVGLERRLVAEKAKPKADIFWNSEFLRTYRLNRQGVLAPMPADATKGGNIPPDFLSPYGIGFGVRCRVIAVNTAQVASADRPMTLDDLTAPRFKGKVAISSPLFGATSTHFAAMHARWGAERFIAFLQALKRNEVVILPGNADVRDAVAAGRVLVGVTDSDDAVGSIRRGQPLAMVFPDQADEGAFGLYMTVARVAGRPANPDTAKLIDYLSSRATEKRLIEMGAVQFSVRPGGPMASEVGAARPKIWFMDPARIDASLAPAAELIKKYLL